MNQFSDMYVLFAIGILIFFLISFFSIQTGIAVMTISMLFSPEIHIGSMSTRSITLRIEDVLIPVLVLALIAHIGTEKDRQMIVRSPLNKPMFFLIIASVGSTLWGIVTGWVEPTTAFFYILKTAEFFTIFFLVASYVRTERQIQFFLFFAVLTVSLLAFYTLTQVPKVEIFTENRITAPFEGGAEPATVGGYMAFLFLIILSLFLYETKTLMRWIYAGLMIVTLIPFLYTLNRTSYVALVGGLIFIALYEKRKVMRVIFIFLFLTSPWWLPESVKTRIAFTWTDASNPGRELGVDHSLQERIYAFRKWWGTGKYSPVIGWGVSSLNIIDSQYARTLHEIGFLGLGLWIWLFARIFRLTSWLFNTLEQSSLRGFVIGYQAGVIGILLHGFGGITFYIVRIMEPFWFVSGLIVALYLIKAKEAVAVA